MKCILEALTEVNKEVTSHDNLLTSLPGMCHRHHVIVYMAGGGGGARPPGYNAVSCRSGWRSGTCR